jgi:hypothetical protein
VNTHAFILILDKPVDEEAADRPFEAGLDDAAVTAFDGLPALDVDREASTLFDAIASAISQAESVASVRVARVDGEELVSQADIAERSGRTRQAVNHWIGRDADSSGFPDAANGFSNESSPVALGRHTSLARARQARQRSRPHHCPSQRHPAPTAQPPQRQRTAPRRKPPRRKVMRLAPANSHYFGCLVS